jgi:acetolactate synthase-1/2/3 large subunit
MNGAQALFKALTNAGVTTCFANPGTSEMQLVYEIGLTANVSPILCLQEDVVTGAADGYARMKGSPAVTLLHVGSGFANGIAMLHNAGRANTPVINIVGANAAYHQPNLINEINAFVLSLTDDRDTKVVIFKSSNDTIFLLTRSLSTPTINTR